MNTSDKAILGVGAVLAISLIYAICDQMVPTNNWEWFFAILVWAGASVGVTTAILAKRQLRKLR